VTAQDAVMWIGDNVTGTRVQQASNTFNTLAGVSMTFTKAQAVGDAPVTLTVATDSAGTEANVQAFVDAYNNLAKLLGDLTYHGKVKDKVPPGIFANDTGIVALRNAMGNALRTGIGGKSLVNYGISADTDGTLKLNSDFLAKTLKNDPATLQNLFGKSELGSPTGVLGGLGSLMHSWTKTGGGQIKLRNESIDKQQRSLEARSAVLEAQYKTAYDRYLEQFTRLQALQSQMNNTSGLFDAVFSKND
jgi:flagellar hook-associated protein 2